MVKGFLFAAISSCAYGFSPFFALPLMADGIPSLTILFCRFAFSAVILAIVLTMRGVSLVVSKKDFLQLSGISTLYTTAAVLFFYALHYLDSGIVATVHYCYPVVVVLLMVFFFHEKFRLSSLIASLLSFTGVAFFSFQSGEVEINALGMILTLVCALFASLYVITLQIAKLSVSNASLITFYVVSVGSVMLGVVGLINDGLVIPNAMWQWRDLILLALITAAISNLTLVEAVKRIGSSLTAILGCLEPVTAMLLGVFVFHEAFTLENALGMVLIMSSVLVVAIVAHLQKKQFEKVHKTVTTQQ